MRVKTSDDLPFLRSVAMMRPRGRAILGTAILFAAAALIAQNGFAQMTLMLVAATLCGAVAWIWLAGHHVAEGDAAAVAAARALLEAETAPMLLTGAEGRVLYANPAARDTLAADRAPDIRSVLGQRLADPAATVRDLCQRAGQSGQATREITTPRGRLRVSAGRAGAGRMLWRVEDGPNSGGDAEASEAVPVLEFDAAGHLLRANDAAARVFGAPPGDKTALQPLSRARSGEIRHFEPPSGPVSCLLARVARSDGGAAVFAFPLDTPPAAPDAWAFFDALPVPLLKLSRDARIALSNRHARALLGIDSGEGRRLSDLLDGPGRPLTEWLADAAGGRGTIRPEVLRIKDKHRDAFVQVSLNPTQDAGETVLIAVLQDATKLKSLEEQFTQSQKMHAIGQLAGGIAHDFNNLLTAISGHCDLLLLRHDPGDADYADLMQISQNANRAAALVGQLLAYSRKQTLRPEVMDLRDMLADLTHLLNRLVGERITLTLTHDPGLWSVRADRRQLEQVLMNLVVNARDAMPDGGDIVIRTENRTLTEPLQRDRAVVAPGRYVLVEVQDHGTGIPPEALQKIFEPFYTTKRVGEGTGLGLSTAYGIVKQTGGFIFADSTEGQGSTFMLLLPAHDAVQADTPRARPMAARPARVKGVVLLVEDEAPVRAFACRALKMRGLSVLEAATAEAALELLADPTLHVDVFVTDVVMPGMDGPTWVREALKTRPGTRVVFVSGYAADMFADSGKEIPGAMFLPKPFSLTELTQTVQDQIVRAQAAPDQPSGGGGV